MQTFQERPVLFFETQNSWRNWLDEYGSEVDGVWIKLAKKSSGITSISYDEALEEALCYGWVDSQKQTYDKDHYLQKFTPRGPKSIWSKRNVAKIEALMTTDKMRPSGLVAIKNAKENGAWARAYDSSSAMAVPKDFQEALDKNPKAKAFFETLNKTDIYRFCWRIDTAKKAETRKIRIDKFIAMLNDGKKLH